MTADIVSDLPGQPRLGFYIDGEAVSTSASDSGVAIEMDSLCSLRGVKAIVPQRAWTFDSHVLRLGSDGGTAAYSGWYGTYYGMALYNRPLSEVEVKVGVDSIKLAFANSLGHPLHLLKC